VLSALASPSPWRASRRFGRWSTAGQPRLSLGTASDATALLKLVNDKASPKGFPAGVTVGSEAKRVAAVLQKRGG